MAVMQEMAEIYPPEAEDLCEYLPDINCRKCDYDSCMAFAEALLEKKTEPSQCPELSPEFSQLLSSIISLKKEPIPYNTMMEQVPCELIAINNPNKHTPLLITCNFNETVSILEKILTETGTKAFLLPSFTHGYSLDNAVHEKMFKAFEIWKAIQENEVSQKLDQSLLVIPGLAESEKNAIRQLSRWTVLVGPVFRAFNPLVFMGK